MTNQNENRDDFRPTGIKFIDIVLFFAFAFAILLCILFVMNMAEFCIALLFVIWLGHRLYCRIKGYKDNWNWFD